tara:strand:+ start:3538 stop:5325 length:1788 start_codon:yes stop_codon:yes gene_type:complete
MAVTQLDNRGKFLVFESNAVRLNNDIFPAESINVSLSPSIDPLMDIDGRVTNYAPNGSLKGRVDLSFDLTGELPTYFHATGVTEAPTLVKFNTFVIYGYLENLTYEVSAYRPIKVNAGFAFFHGIKYLETQFKDKIPASFDSSLKTYNGLRSYLIGDNDNYCFVSSFNYSLTTRRTPYTKVGFESPTRVALEDVRIEINAQGSNIDNYMNIRGNNTMLIGNLNELYNSNNTVVMPLVGKIVEQSFSASQGSVGQGSFKAIQSLNRIRKNVSIPFVENQLILTATPDRVFELPDFDSTCPPGVIDEQPVDGGDPGRGWTPPGGDYDPCWRVGNCEPGDGGGGGGDDGGGGGGGSDGAGGGSPDKDPSDNDYDASMYEWTSVIVLNSKSYFSDWDAETTVNTSLTDYDGGLRKASRYFDINRNIILTPDRIAPIILVGIEDMKTTVIPFGTTIDYENTDFYTHKGYIGVLKDFNEEDISYSDIRRPTVGECPINDPDDIHYNGETNRDSIGPPNYECVFVHRAFYYHGENIIDGTLECAETGYVGCNLTISNLNNAVEWADTIEEAQANTGRYYLKLTWEDEARCKYFDFSVDYCGV